VRHPTTRTVVCSGSAAHIGALRAEAAEEPLCTCMMRLSVVWLALSPPTITTTSTSVASGRKMEMHGRRVVTTEGRNVCFCEILSKRASKARADAAQSMAAQNKRLSAIHTRTGYCTRPNATANA